MITKLKLGITVAAFALGLLALHAAVGSQQSGSAKAATGSAVSLEGYFGASPSDEQSAMLADGVVTEAEVRAALNSAADCLEANGVRATRLGDPQLEGNLVLGYFVPDGGDRARARDIVQKCDTEHSAYVTSAYRVQTRGSSPSNPVLGPDGKPVQAER